MLVSQRLYIALVGGPLAAGAPWGKRRAKKTGPQASPGVSKPQSRSAPPPTTHRNTLRRTGSSAALRSWDGPREAGGTNAKRYQASYDPAFADRKALT